ncbi:TPA: polysaccharide pyruvyl transferase family protein [Morganella morganii]
MGLFLANGAVKNSGDFLIRDSFNSFFQKNSNLEYKKILYSELINTNLCNETIIFSGGPVFEFKFQHLLSAAPHKNCRYIFFGAGSYLFNYSTKFSSLPFSGKKENISVRDEITKKIFNLDTAFVTGCAASYLRESMDKVVVKNNKIAISAPQRYDYFPYTYDLINKIISLGYDVDILFNRGWDKSEYTSGLTQRKTNIFVNFLQNKGFNVIDASGEHGMKKYDTYKCHIGFRLHSHYYFLQNNLPSKLLVEDSRGLGSNLLFNDTVIWPYNHELNLSFLNKYPNKITAAIFRGIDKFNIRKTLNKSDAFDIEKFLNNPCLHKERQLELEHNGKLFLSSRLNGL